MIGPAEIEDMLSEYADAQPAPNKMASPELQSRQPSRWSWGSGPAAVVVEGHGAVVPVAVDRLCSHCMHASTLDE